MAVINSNQGGAKTALTTAFSPTAFRSTCWAVWWRWSPASRLTSFLKNERAKKAAENAGWTTPSEGRACTVYNHFSRTGNMVVDARSAGQLRPICVFQVGDEGNFQTGPIVYQGTIYIVKYQQNDNDVVQAARTLHTLRDLQLNIRGPTACRKICNRLELNCRIGRLEDFSTALARVTEAYRATINELRNNYPVNPAIIGIQG